VNDLRIGNTTLDSLAQTVSLISKDIRDDGESTRELIKQEELKTRDQVKIIQQQLDKEAASRITEDQRQSFLNSLSYPTIQSRLEAIHDPHDGTFMWIFDGDVNDGSTSDDETAYRHSLNESLANMAANPPPEREAICSLKDWLQTSSNTADHTPDIYWVSGKPGSGKSTLMKFLANDWLNEGKVMELLEQRAEGLDVLTPSFYFWKPGTPEQKSLAGMLRSLVIQLVSADDNLFNGLIDYLSSKKKLKRMHTKLECQWTVPNLNLALDYLVSATEAQFMICLFIDGLDEFEDSQISRNELLRAKLASWQHVKLCVASRPEQAFEDEYGAGSYLKLEDLTYASIAKFVEDKLRAHTRWHTLTSLESPTSLLHALVRKAEGVFLWVVLAVHDIEKGLDDRNNLETLFTKLAKLPSELTDLYTRMLSIMSQEYQDVARKIFQWMLDRPKEEMELIDLMFLLWPEDMQYSTSSKNNFVDASSRLSAPTENLKVILRTRCVGMLEVKRSEGVEAFGSEVRFVHRSAYDFLLASETGKAFMKTRPQQIQDRYTSYVSMILDNPFQTLEARGHELHCLFADFILIASPEEHTYVMTFLNDKLAIKGFTDHSDILDQLLNKPVKDSVRSVRLKTALDFAAFFGLINYVNPLLGKDTDGNLKADHLRHEKLRARLTGSFT